MLGDICASRLAYLAYFCLTITPIDKTGQSMQVERPKFKHHHNLNSQGKKKSHKLKYYAKPKGKYKKMDDGGLQI